MFWLNMAKMLATNQNYYLWSPVEYLGWQPFSVISPFAYVVIAFVSGSFRIDVVEIFQLSFATCVLLTGVAIFLLSRLLLVPRLLAIGIASILWVTPSYWSMSIGGGTYDRVWYFPLIFLSVALVYFQVRSINLANASTGIHVFALVGLILIGVSDLYDFLIALFFIVPLYLIGIRGMKLAVSWFLRMSLGLATVDAWFLLPSISGIFHRASQTGMLHVTTPNPVSWLVLPTSTFSWAYTHSLNPLYIPVGAASILLPILGGNMFHLERPRLGLLTGASIATGYFLLTGWAYVPSSLRVMASYSSGDWIAFTLIVVMISGFGAFFQSKRSTRVSHLLGIGLIVALMVTSVVFLPLMKVSDNGQADRGILSLSNSLSQCCGDQYRAAVVNSRIIYRSLGYYDPSIQVTGGRFAYYNQNPDYVNWAADRIFFRADESVVPSIYVDDRPTYTRFNYGGIPNWYSSLFWLDWFGAKGIVFAPWEIPDSATQTGYQARGQFFSDFTTVSTTYGPTSVIQNNDVSPISIATNSTIVGVLSDNCPSENCYFNLLDSLSYVDLDSRYVIPIQLVASDLANFSPTVLIVVGTSMLSDPNVQNYVSKGGRVVVFDESSPDVPCSFNSSVHSVPGSIVFANCSLEELNATGILGSIHLAKLILSESQVVSEPLLMSENQNVTNQNVSGNRFSISFEKAATGVISSTTSDMHITLIPTSQVSYHQVNASASLNETIDLEGSGFVSFNVETNASVSFGVSFANDQSTNYWASNGGVNLDLSPRLVQSIALPISDFVPHDNSMFFSNSRSLIFSLSTPASDTQSVNVTFSTINVQNGPSTHLYASPPIDPTTPGIVEFTTNSTVPTVIRVRTAPFAVSLDVSPTSDNRVNETYFLPMASFPLGSPTDILGFSIYSLTGNSSFVSETPIHIQSAGIITFRKASFLGVNGTWLEPNDYKILSIPKGYQGLLWKETFTSAWSAIADGTASNKLAYLYAGPQLIYVPLFNSNGQTKGVGDLNFLEGSTTAQTYGSIISLSSILATSIIIVFERRFRKLGVIFLSKFHIARRL